MKVYKRSSLLSLSSYILLLSLLLHIANAAADGKSHLMTINYGVEALMQADPLMPIGSSSQEIDLVSFLNTKSQHHDAIFNEALSLLESMRSSPSCNRMAATRLVTSCQSIGSKADRNEADNYMALDHVKSLYAARLAICELNGAGASVPPPCLSVTVTPPQKKGFLGFSTKGKSQTTVVDSMPADTLESCLRSLESRPQWWTSYSNSRQNAVVICQAARIEIEKEELLELHRSTVENTFELNNRLQEVLQNAAAESLRHKDFLREVDAMRARVSYELGETESYIKRKFSNLLHDVESAVGSVVSGMTSALGRVHMETTILEKVYELFLHENQCLHTVGHQKCYQQSRPSTDGASVSA